MTRCAFCDQVYTGLKADHFKACRAIGYALGDLDFCDLESALASKTSIKNTASAKKRYDRRHTNSGNRKNTKRGRIPVFGKQSPNFKK